MADEKRPDITANIATFVNFAFSSIAIAIAIAFAVAVAVAIAPNIVAPNFVALFCKGSKHLLVALHLLILTVLPFLFRRAWKVPKDFTRCGLCLKVGGVNAELDPDTFLSQGGQATRNYFIAIHGNYCIESLINCASYLLREARHNRQ